MGRYKTSFKRFQAISSANTKSRFTDLVNKLAILVMDSFYQIFSVYQCWALGSSTVGILINASVVVNITSILLQSTLQHFKMQHFALFKHAI